MFEKSFGNSQEGGESKKDLAHAYAVSMFGEEPKNATRPEKDYYWDNYYDAFYDYLDGNNLDPVKKKQSDSLFDDESRYLDEDSPTIDPSFLKGIKSLMGIPSRTPEDLERPIFFRYPEGRKQVFQFSKAIAEYLKKENIKDLVIVDRSSRPFYIGVMEYWKSAYPAEPMPHIYFVNPKGFKDKESLSRSELMRSDFAGTLAEDPSESLSKVRTRKEIDHEFTETYKDLVKDKKKPILLFDTCIHSGDTLLSVVNAFKRLGFKDARVGSITPTDHHSSVKTNFYIIKQNPEMGCYPFDRDRMIEKTFERVYSRRSDDSFKRKIGIALRKEIKEIVGEYIKQETSSK